MDVDVRDRLHGPDSCRDAALDQLLQLFEGEGGGKDRVAGPAIGRRVDHSHGLDVDDHVLERRERCHGGLLRTGSNGMGLGDGDGGRDLDRGIADQIRPEPPVADVCHGLHAGDGRHGVDKSRDLCCAERVGVQQIARGRHGNPPAGIHNHPCNQERAQGVQHREPHPHPAQPHHCHHRRQCVRPMVPRIGQQELGRVCICHPLGRPEQPLLPCNRHHRSRHPHPHQPPTPTSAHLLPSPRSKRHQRLHPMHCNPSSRCHQQPRNRQRRHRLQPPVPIRMRCIRRNRPHLAPHQRDCVRNKIRQRVCCICKKHRRVDRNARPCFERSQRHIHPRSNPSNPRLGRLSLL